MAVAAACAHAADGEVAGRIAEAREAEEPSPFSASVREYRGVMKLVRALPPLDETDGLRSALRAMATAVRTIPDASKPMLDEAAALVRDREFQLWVDARRSLAGGSRHAREALQIASAALLVVARGSYAEEPALADAAAKMRASAHRIDDTKELAHNRASVLEALEHALRALETIEAASSPGTDAR